ncbi:hypothetical protein PDQ34_24420 [Bacillus cereus]|nr:hypothetical protein [Bacillus cereus]MDA2572192.1 hypothetical protein [Bacillus cereus]
MADIKDANYVIKQLIEEFNLQDGQYVDHVKIAKMIARSQELYKEKYAYDKK